jgi:hypothetical protein
MEERMSELAFNLNGEPFDVPAEAVGWRVRKMKHKGAPEVVYGRNGLPLTLPIEADLDDVRQETGAPGRYRLDPIDDTRKPILNAPAGYVVIHDVPHVVIANDVARGLPPASDNVVIEAMRMNAEIAKSVVDRFPMMLEAASTLLRAADGAGLPARSPRLIEVDDSSEEDDQDEEDDTDHSPAAGGFDLNAIVAQLVPLIVTSLMSGKLKIPGLGELFDWRKAGERGKAKPTAKPHRAVPQTEVNPAAVADEDAASDEAETPGVEAMLPPIDPATLVHFVAIQQALKPEEAALARAVAADLGPAELRAWFDDLKKLGVPDAVAKIRALVAKKGGAS